MNTIVIGSEVAGLREQLAAIREQGVNPGLLRWCGWLDCMRSFRADTGGRGWWRGMSNMMLLCPPHAAAGHCPSTGYDREQEIFAGSCQCGAASGPLTPQNFESATAWWHQHLAELAVEDPLAGDQIVSVTMTAGAAEQFHASLLHAAARLPQRKKVESTAPMDHYDWLLWGASRVSVAAPI